VFINIFNFLINMNVILRQFSRIPCAHVPQKGARQASSMPVPKEVYPLGLFLGAAVCGGIGFGFHKLSEVLDERNIDPTTHEMLNDPTIINPVVTSLTNGKMLNSNGRMVLEMQEEHQTISH
jgi:hypothetical protein